MQHEWLKKGIHSPKLCLHHLPVIKKFSHKPILPPSPSKVKWSTPKSPEMGDLSMNGVVKESPKMRTVIN